MTPPGEIARDAAALPRETGGFRLLRVLGRGGMGVVYEAEELASGRRVALKVLVQELSLSGEAFERFRREARIAASVSDSSCVFVFGAHVIEGSPAIAMELCAGETLEHRIASGRPVPTEDAVRWTIEILDGLEAAHRAGVVHRDVKPSNCFTTAQGRVKVGDFGLSRSLEQDVQLTRSGVFLGSPLYASPEQVRGREVDLRSDIYSTGATLYALLTGRSPYHGENLGEVLARILSESPVPPSQLRKGIPRGLDKVVLRAMSRDPAQRFQSHAAMRDALRAFVGQETKAASPWRRFLAYMADSWVVSLVNIPVMAIWTQFDPMATQPIPDQPWRLHSPGMMLSMSAAGFLYFLLAEGLFGRTVGKWITGQSLAVVGDSSHVVRLRMLRAAVWWTPSLLSGLSGLFLGGAPAWLSLSLGTGLQLGGSLAMLLTMRPRNGWRGLHEFASRTRVVAEPLPFARFVRRKAPPPTRLEPSGELPARIGAYETVGRVGRTASGEILEASDTHLDRRVWIHRRDPAAPPLAQDRRSLERATRLRWLDGFEEHGSRHEVFEAPGGARLLDCCVGEERLSWPMAHGMLSALAEEVDREPAPRISLEQIWIDRSWSLRILDEPLGESSAPGHAPLELLALAARTSLGLSDASGLHLPPDLPEHAEESTRRLLGLAEPFASVGEARRSLLESANRPQGIDRKIRGLQLLLGSGIWTLLCLLMLGSTRFIVLPRAIEMETAATGLVELRAGRHLTAEDVSKTDPSPSGAAIDAEGLRARSILAAGIVEQTSPFNRGVTVKLSPEERDLVARMREQYGGATRAEIESAQALVESELPAGYGRGKDPSVRIFRMMIYVLPFYLALAWAATAVLGAFLARGGCSLRMMSLAVRDTKGRRAGRWRCTLRAAVTALPFLAVYLVPYVLAIAKRPGAAGVALLAAVLVQFLLVAMSLRTPARGWQDRIAGTRLVPR